MSNPDNDFESTIPTSPVYAVEMENVKCEDVDFISLSCKLSCQLSVDAVGRYLGLSESQVQDALKWTNERHQDHNKVHLLLMKWREVNEDSATWGALVEQSQSNPEIADIIKSELQEALSRITLRGIDTPPQEETNPLSPSEMAMGVKPFAGDDHDGLQESLPLPEVGTSFRESNEQEYPALYQELVTGMTTRAQAIRFLNEAAISELSEDVRKFETKFAGLLCTAHDALKHAGIPDSAIRIFLTQLSVSQKENIPLYDQRMAGIISHISLEEIILFCSRIGVWDFLNFQLLQDLVDNFGIENLQTPLQEYKISVNVFKKNTKLVDFLRVWAGRNTLHTLPDSKPVFARIKAIDWEKYTLADVARHEKYLSAEFRLNQLYLRFSNAGEGSVVLMWLVTKSVASQMQRIMRDEMPTFDSMTFQELNIGGRTFEVTADYDSIYNHSIKNPDIFWADRAREYLHWEQPFDAVMEGVPLGIRWFRGGKINASVNCLDRHVARDPSTVAIVWEKDEPGKQEEVSYKELLEKTCQIANVLRDAGVKKGDKVMIYMPAMPLAVAAMLACARMGAVHCVVFSTFGPNDLKERISDTKPKVIITGDERVQGGETHALKENLDKALKGSGHEVDQIFVASRTGKEVPMTPDRDVSLEEEMEKQPTEFDPVPMDSEDDLFIAYTSGTTSKPRLIVHTQAGYLLYAAFTHKFIFDFQPGDIFGCLADLGWVAGHTSVVYGPLCNGATAVLFESVATYPNCERYWEMVERLKLTHLYTIPTVMKFLMKAGNEHVEKHNLSSLRVLALAGEPLTPAIQDWCYNVVGRKRCLLLDSWWQTETGSIAITRWFAPEGKKPSHFPAKPSFPFFGVEPCLIEEKPTLKVQNSDDHEVQGCLLLKRPLPGMGRKANDSYDEFKHLYFQQPKAEGYFCTYDLAKCDNEGNYQITGRVDDAIRIKGVWLEVPKIESVMDESDHRIQETLLVGYECSEASRPPGDTQCTCVFVGLKKGVERTFKTITEVIQKLKNAVQRSFGNDAVPQGCLITELLPKTFSGKNVRMLLKSVAQHPSMKGKQEVNMSEIKKYGGPDFGGVFMNVADMMLIRT